MMRLYLSSYQIGERGDLLSAMVRGARRGHVIMNAVDGLHRDAFVYAGFSAGACTLAPSLVGLELCDPVEDCLAAYGEVREEGLGVLDRPVVPHLDTPGHPESEVLGEVARRYRENGQEYWALADGQALVIDEHGVAVR